MPKSRHKIVEPVREIDVVHETDVLVVGSGPGGLAAAIGAARAGTNVTLVERFGCFGGNITVVGVEGMAWYRHEMTIEANGLGREMEERAKAMGAALPESQSLSYELDSEGFKVVADRMVEEAGIHPMLHRLFVAPVMDGDTITGIVTESKAGREAILAKRIVDATGDADVAARAGAPVFKTPKEQMMAASVMFHLSGVNKQKFMDGVRADPQTYKDWGGGGEWNIETTGKEDHMFSPFIKKPFQRAIEEGLLPANLNTIAGTWGAIHDSGELTYMNLIHLDQCDGTDPEDLTKFEIEGRRQTMMAIDALRRYMPGCESARLRNFGMTIGIRDTRKIDAAYNMTETDVREQGRFEDSIGIYPEFIDGYGILILPTTGRYFQIPYRSLLPKKVKNLLVAGRAIGGDRVSHAAIRNMSCCAVTGQGAGIAAALSLKSKTDLDQNRHRTGAGRTRPTGRSSLLIDFPIILEFASVS
jgi:ribulose 1,5-bisphosphate synthetase/thiazole synthase